MKKTSKGAVQELKYQKRAIVQCQLKLLKRVNQNQIAAEEQSIQEKGHKIK